MATLEIDTRPRLLPAPPITASPFRHVRRRRKRLALISTHDDLCGIAAYTRCLQKQLNDVFEVTVFDLDQYLLRSTHGRVRKFGDRHILDMCREIREYDAVNLQLEHGTLGRDCHDIHRRFSWILRAAPRLSVTFHTVFQCEAFNYREYFREILRRNFARAIAMRAQYHREHLLSAGLASRLRRAQRFKAVTLIVHTRRDLSQMKFAYGMRNVYDHPLSFLSAAEVAEVRRAASRKKFPVLDNVPAGSRLIGVFGFLGRYKGFDTVVRALHHLPKDHHLPIFGGVHPNEIKPHQPIDPVVSSLFDAGYVDTSVAERILSGGEGTSPAVSVAVDSSMRDLLIEHPKDLSDRIHFMGAQSDPDFLGGMAICDAVVFPYLEVGQSSSGQFRRHWSWAAVSLLRGPIPLFSSAATITTSSSSSTSGTTSNWPGASGRGRNSSVGSIFRHSMWRPTRRSTSPPTAPPGGFPGQPLTQSQKARDNRLLRTYDRCCRFELKASANGGAQNEKRVSRL